ncbi:MAG: 16S rRNA (cytosine(1402)-N(4))-methyltransferase RsmH [Thermodesulfobacteriota bacterium]
MEEPRHKPVLLAEAIKFLICDPEGMYVDGTVGSGGHALLILERTAPEGRLIGLDWDTQAIRRARQNLAFFGKRVTLINKNFKEIGEVLKNLAINKVNGILLDLGISKEQIEDGERGFSFQREGPLDMRLSEEITITARDLINNLSAAELRDIFRTYGEEKWAGRIAKAIVRQRQSAPINSTRELVNIIKKAIPCYPSRLHPATRTFQALRIAVNKELENLEIFLNQAPELLLPQGRMVIISYHSLEDRLVKNSFRELVRGNKQESSAFHLLTPKPVTPTREEITTNPRARSAKLRAIEKIY